MNAETGRLKSREEDTNNITNQQEAKQSITRILNEVTRNSRFFLLADYHAQSKNPDFATVCCLTVTTHCVAAELVER
jgi:hypothetical protein